MGRPFDSVNDIRQYIRSLPSYEWYYTSTPIYYTTKLGETYEIPRNKLCRYIVGDRLRNAATDGYFMGVLWIYDKHRSYSHWDSFTYTKDGRMFMITSQGNVQPMLGWEDFKFDW